MTTYVLVHGSYQGGWIWKDVAGRLRAAGHLVYAPTLDGCGERKDQVRAGITTETQADEVAQLLFYEDLRDVVLAGTSSGGMVVCRVAELARDRIKRLVFVDALALLPGEKIRDIVTRSTATSAGLTAGPSREDAANRLFADLDPKLRDFALERYTQHPIGIYDQGVKLDSFWSQQWPGTQVIWCKGAPNPGEAHQRRTAEKLGAKFAELDTGHYPMLSMPAELTQMLLAG
ncbi:MAG TPA: alpha/beta hydrolase [Stellaceae bacterium]|jgi:pimeloyl-ACP methyl ester carboxylesterase|nr:alpha/beta hydrolase [Stellaceae bacterium]